VRHDHSLNPVTELELEENAPDVGLHRELRHPNVGSRPSRGGVLCATARVEGLRVEQRPDPMQGRGVVAVEASVHRHLAGGRAVQSDDYAHRRGFACPLGPIPGCRLVRCPSGGSSRPHDPEWSVLLPVCRGAELDFAVWGGPGPAIDHRRWTSRPGRSTPGRSRALTAPGPTG
jgi:hypothetical protein